MRAKRIAAAILAVLLAVAAYWYWSPYVALRTMQKAAREGDAQTFNAHVDYPRLRESLKSQLGAVIAQAMGGGSQQSAGNPFAALGAMIGMGLVNQMVDTMVRPETMMVAIRQGAMASFGKAGMSANPAATTDSADASSSSSPAGQHPAGAAPAGEVHWIIERLGANRLTARAADPARPSESSSKQLALEFERAGLFHWNLVDVRLPSSTVEQR